MQLLKQSLVQQHLSMSMAIDAIESLLRIQTNNPDWIKCPERLVIPTFSNSSDNSTGSHLTMPAVVYDGAKEYSIVKLVTICPDNPSRNLPTTTAVVTVSDNSTGEILAFMDGVYVTQVRTAALSGIASKYMADPESTTVAVLGCGGMAYEQLNAVLTVCPNIKQINLWNRSSQGAQTFKQQFEQNYLQQIYPERQIDIEVFDSSEKGKNAAIANADIINLATRAESGLFSLDAINKHVHINAVGAYLPSMQEVSSDVVAACSHVFVDDMAGSRHEAGDLIQAHDDEQCSWCWDDLTGDLAALVSGQQVVEQQQKGVSLFKSVGAASFDAAVALKIAQLAKSDKLGETICW